MEFRYIKDPAYYHHYHRQRHSIRPNHSYQQQQAYYGDLYYKPTRSSSTGTIHYRRHQEAKDQYYMDHNLYYNQHQEDHVSIPAAQKRRNKIDRTVYLDDDGELLNDLEVLALKNANKNKRKSKIVYEEEEEVATIQKEEEEEIAVEVAIQEKEAISTTVQKGDLTNMMESLTMIDSASCSSTLIEEEETTIKMKKKKQRWPLFAFLFNKKQDKQPPIPTPVLSPDSNSSTSTFEESGYWAFKYPNMTPIVWIPFDNENQTKIFNHVEHVVQFTDSHFCNGQLSIAVVPLQRACFIPIDIAANQIACLELSFITSKR